MDASVFPVLSLRLLLSYLFIYFVLFRLVCLFLFCLILFFLSIFFSKNACLLHNERMGRTNIIRIYCMKTIYFQFLKMVKKRLAH